MREDQALDRAVIVLVQPLQPGNVGASLRAMRNCGLSRLVVVDPQGFDMERARWMAPRCDEDWERVRFVATLDEALEGVHRVIATTGRHRGDEQEVIGPDAAATRILDDEEATTAILFGREDFGLPRDATARAEVLLRIPTMDHWSLNLSQAVLICCYALFDEARRRELVHGKGGRVRAGGGTRRTADLDPSGRAHRRAPMQLVEPTAQALVSLLDRVGYFVGRDSERTALDTRAAIQRAALSVKETQALRGMVKKVQWALDHPDVEWGLSRKENEARQTED